MKYYINIIKLAKNRKGSNVFWSWAYNGNMELAWTIQI